MNSVSDKRVKWEKLKECCLFAALTDSELLSIVNQYIDKIKCRKFSTGETVFHASDEAKHMAVVLSGRVRVEKLLPNGSYLTIAVKKCGDMIGEAAVFSKIALYPCEITAETESELLFINRDVMLQLLSEYPDTLSSFLTELSSMTYALQQRVELLSYSGICEKIAFFLLSQYNVTKDSRIRIPGSITSMSQQLKVSRTSLHREITKLKREHIIATEKGYIKILDIAALKNLLV